MKLKQIKQKIKKVILSSLMMTFSGLSITLSLAVAEVKVPIYLTEDGKTPNKKEIGFIVAKDTSYGLLLTPNLTALPTGALPFHLHEHPSCENHGLASGDHFNPDKDHKHWGPYNEEGHLGDLPALVVNKKGIAELPVLAPRLKVKDLSGHAFVIHQGNETYTPDATYPDRIACGVIP